MPSKKAATICIYPRKVSLQLQVYLNVWIAVQAVDDQMMHVMSCLHTALYAMAFETSQGFSLWSMPTTKQSCNCHQVMQLAMQTHCTSTHAVWTASIAAEQCHTQGPGRWSCHPQLHLVSFIHSRIGQSPHRTSKIATDCKGSDRLTGVDSKLYILEHMDTISMRVAQKLTFHQLGPIPMQAFTTKPM